MPDLPRLIPAVSLRGGDVVVVRDQRYEPIEDERGRAFSLDEFCQVFLKAFDAVLVFDIDGMDGEGAQFDEAARLEGSRLEVWWDAGVRDHDDVIGILTSGAHKAVVSTTSLQSARELGQAVELSDSVVFEVVMRDGVVTGGSPDFRGQPLHAALRKGAQQRVEEVLVLDASRPLGAPVDFQGLESLPAPFESLYLGGGIDVATAKALRAPPSVPYKGAVVDLISVLAPFL